MEIIKTRRGKEAITRTSLDKDKFYLEVCTYRNFYNNVVSIIIKYKKFEDQSVMVEFDNKGKNSLSHGDVKRLTEEKLKELHLKAIDHFDLYKDNKYQRI